MSQVKTLPDLVGSLPVVGSRDKAKARWITVEPVLFLAMIGYGTIGTMRTQYIRDRIAADKFNYTFDNTNSSCVLDDKQLHIEREIQSEAAFWTMLLSLCSYIPPLFSAIVIGTWSDNHRRKTALLFPVVGMTVQSAIYLAIVSLRLPIPVAFAGELIQGLTGGLPLLLSGCLSYIADVTDAQHRMYRIVVVETTMLVGIGGSQIGLGYLLTLTGYIPPFYVVLVLLLLDICYILIPPFLLETIVSDGIRDVRHQIQKLLHGMYRLFKVNHNGRRSRLVALGSTSFLLTFMTTGYMNMVVLFGLGDPFCWTPDIVGIFMAMSLGAGGIGLAIGTKLFSLCLGEYWIIHIGTFSLLFTMLTISLANTTAFIFITSLVFCLRTISAPVIRSQMSRTVESHEQGVMFSCVTSAESIAMFSAPLLLQTIYSATVEYNPHVCFYVATVICILPIFLTIFLQYKSYKESNSYSRMISVGEEDFSSSKGDSINDDKP